MNIKQICIIAFTAISVLLVYKCNSPQNKQVVNVYGWYGIIPISVIKNFEKESGIEVRYDVYDNNSVLEAKLLASDCGYDVVFPSYVPYAFRQFYIGAYKKFESSSVPNMRNISPIFLLKINNPYIIPYFWGTIGLGINKNFIPDVHHGPLDIIFNPDILKTLHPYGVSFPEEYSDIFHQTMKYLNISNYKRDHKHADLFRNHFTKIRPYITKFSSTTIINDLATGEICMGIGSSDNIYRAIRAAKKVGKEIQYMSTGLLWIDCICIPANSRNSENAEKFINYLLRNDVAEQITNHSGIMTTITGSYDALKNETNDDTLFPQETMIEKLEFSKYGATTQDMDFEKLATRAWAEIRINR